MRIIQESFNMISDDVPKKDISINPNLTNVYYNKYLFSFLKYKIRGLYELFKIDPLQTDLKIALEASEIVIDYLNTNIFKIERESGKYVITEDNYDIFELGQQIAKEIYLQTNDRKYLEKAYEIKEKSRSFTLLYSLRSREAIEFSNIPENLLSQERDLRNKISTYEELLYQENQKQDPDKNKIYNWEEAYLNYSKEYEKLIRFFEDNYPDYYNLKFNTDVISVKEIQDKLRRNEVILEYTLMDSVLYTYIISKRNNRLIEQDVDSSLVINMMNFYDVITQQRL